MDTLWKLSFACILGLCSAQARTWQDAQSGRTLDAELVTSNAQAVTLRRADGTVFVLPVARLSAEDRAFIASGQPAPRDVNTTAKVGKDRFEDIRPFKKDAVPVAGEAVKKFASVDDAVLDFMVAKGIPAVSLAISQNGKLLHERAFGWGDASLKTPLPTGLAMRLASISKPITQAAIHTLVAAGKLKLEDKVFEVLELEKLATKSLDPRWRQITIAQLLLHKGGWDRGIAGDFSYKSQQICDDLHIKLTDMVAMDLVRWHLLRPLDFDPGAREVYCNFGYTLLARVVEKLSGQTFVAYLQATVGKESGMSTLRVSRSDAPDREPGEVWYCFHPEVSSEVKAFPVRFETKDGSGALACSAADYCRFLEHYAINGSQRRAGGKYRGTFFGSTHGTTSVCCQREDGLCYTVICNRRSGDEAWNRELKEDVDKALAAAGM